MAPMAFSRNPRASMPRPLPLTVKAQALTAVITITLFSIFAYLQYERERLAEEISLSERMRGQAQSFALSAAQAVWDFNTDYLQSASESLIEHPDIDGVIIRDEQGAILMQSGDMVRDRNHFIARSRVIYHEGDKEKDLGQVELNITRTVIKEQLADYLKSIGFGAVVFILLQLLILHHILRRLLQPLQEITQTMRDLAGGDMALPIPSQERRDEIGQMARAIQVFKDTALKADMLAQEVKARRALQRQLEDAKEIAEAANLSKSRFLANMSHEIRTPLNGIIGMTAILADTPLSDEQREHFQVIESSGELLLQIVNDILDISKLEAAQVKLEKITFDLRLLAEDLVSIVKPSLRERPIVLELNYAANLPARFIGDPTRLRQILLNLLSNAAKFTKSGIISLSIDGEKAEEGHSWNLDMSVRDTGIGISPDQLEHIFDKFTQADVSTTRTYGGTGLGLSITRELVHLFGGVVQVDSAQGKGSVFHVKIPLPEATA